MNAVLMVVAAGAVLAQTGGEGWHVPPCDAPADECAERWGAPVKSEAVEGDLQMPARWTAADVMRALESASPRARCIVRYEIGGRNYDPWAVGSAGERGPSQLHSRGMLPLFTRWSGGAAPENPYQAIPFLDWALANGHARAWSPVNRGLC